MLQQQINAIPAADLIRALTPEQLTELAKEIIRELPVTRQIAVGRTLAHELSCYDLAGDRIDQGLDFAEMDAEHEAQIVELGLFAVTAKVNPWNGDARS